LAIKIIISETGKHLKLKYVSTHKRRTLRIVSEIETRNFVKNDGLRPRKTSNCPLDIAVSNGRKFVKFEVIAS
jgi:hypothetical protein